MKKEQLFEVLGDISESYINEARQTPVKKATPAWRKWGAMVACFCLFFSGILAAWRLNNQPSINDLPDPTQYVPGLSDPPQYVPSYSSPELDDLYKEEPYSVLLPTKIPETLSLDSSYKAEYDPIANPDSEQYLWLGFCSKQNDSSMELRVMEYNGKTPMADPTKADTYDISLYYDYLKIPGTVGADAPKITGLFWAKDLSLSIVEKRMYVFDDGLCKAEIQILCGKYEVCYNYAGTEISPQLFYEVITSSQYFLRMLDIVAE